jgi:hypothetical protein
MKWWVTNTLIILLSEFLEISKKKIIGKNYLFSEGIF